MNEFRKLPVWTTEKTRKLELTDFPTAVLLDEMEYEIPAPTVRGLGFPLSPTAPGSLRFESRLNFHPRKAKQLLKAKPFAFQHSSRPGLGGTFLLGASLPGRRPLPPSPCGA